MMNNLYYSFQKNLHKTRFFCPNIVDTNILMSIYIYEYKTDQLFLEKYLGRVYLIHFKKAVYKILIPLYMYLFVAGIFG